MLPSPGECLHVLLLGTCHSQQSEIGDILNSLNDTAEFHFRQAPYTPNPPVFQPTVFQDSNFTHGRLSRTLTHGKSWTPTSIPLPCESVDTLLSFSNAFP